MRLSLRTTQRVVMTPLLQQAIQLLQLSTLELEQVVRKELEENPLLKELPEEEQDVDGQAPRPPPRRGLRSCSVGITSEHVSRGVVAHRHSWVRGPPWSWVSPSEQPNLDETWTPRTPRRPFNQ